MECSLVLHSDEDQTETNHRRERCTSLSAAALYSNRTIEEVKRLGVSHPTIEVKDKTTYLSDKGVTALNRVAHLISDLPALSGYVSKREIDTEVLRSYNLWIERHPQPTGQEFTEGVADALLALVKDYEFLILVEGIDLKNQDVVELGSVRIRRCSRALLESVKFGGNLNLDSVYEQFKDNLWLIGASRGSADIASEKFKYLATLTIGVIALYGAVLYRGAMCGLVRVR